MSRHRVSIALGASLVGLLVALPPAARGEDAARRPLPHYGPIITGRHRHFHRIPAFARILVLRQPVFEAPPLILTPPVTVPQPVRPAAPFD